MCWQDRLSAPGLTVGCLGSVLASRKFVECELWVLIQDLRS